MLLDADHFEAINDAHGHLGGDWALVAVAAELAAAVETNGTVCRMGGEEFAILLPDAAIEQALMLARDVCRRIETAKVMAPDNARISVTVSAGIACG